MTPEQEIYRANRAQEILDNEVWIEAFTEIDKELIEQWKQAPARDLIGKENLWLQQRLLSKLKITIESVMQGGKVAEANLRHKQTLIERANAWLS